MGNEGRGTAITAAGMAVLALLAAPAAADYFLIGGLEQYTHLNGTNVTIKGKLLSDGPSVASQNIEFRFVQKATGTVVFGPPNNKANKTTGANGEFLHVVPAANWTMAPGLYSFQASFPGGPASATPVEFRVTDPSEPQTFQGMLVYNHTLLPLSAGHAIVVNSNGGLDLSDADTRGGCGTLAGTGLCAVVNTTSRVVHIDRNNDRALNSTNGTDLADLASGSKIRWAGNTWEVRFYPSGRFLLFTRPAPATMTSNSPAFNVLAAALDSAGNNTSAPGLLMNLFSDSGTPVAGVAGPMNPVAGATGLFQSSASLNPAARTDGLYHIVFNNTSTLSFSISNVQASGALLDSSGSPRFTAPPGAAGVLSLSLVNSTSGSPLTGATATATLAGTNHTLVYNASLGTYRKEVAAPTAAGTYDVTFQASVNGSTYNAYARFEVGTLDLFLIPVAREDDRASVFAPGTNGYLVVAGSNLSTGGPAEVDKLTGSDASNFTFALFNDTGAEVGVGWNVTNLSAFFVQSGAPDFVRSELQSQASNSSVVNFTVPAKTGLYRAQVGLNLSGSVKTVETTIGVQSLFVHGNPVDSSGGFSFLASPRSNVTLRINAWDPKNFQTLCGDKIHGAGLLEVVNDSGDPVTDLMENPSLVSLAGFPGDPCPGKGLKFFNNATTFGFHRVRFWINATVNNNVTRAAGNGWFETRAYLSWAQPVDPATGGWRAFGSTSNITLAANVRDTRFNVPATPILVTVEEIRFSENFQKVPFNNSSQTPSCSTSTTSGNCTLTINPDSDLASGFYNARIKISGQDPADPNKTVTDSGHGWFGVRNFYLTTYPLQWEFRPGEDFNINFDANGVVNWTSLALDDLRLQKVIYRGEDYRSAKEVYSGGEPCLDSTGVCDRPTMDVKQVRIKSGGVGIVQGGSYELVFLGTNGSLSETARAHVFARPFFAQAYASGFQNQFESGKNMTIILQACNAGFVWETGGLSCLTGLNHTLNITTGATNITKIVRNWAFSTPFRTSATLTNTTVTQPAPGRVQFDMNLTGWPSGTYLAEIKAVNTTGSSVTLQFYFEVSLARVAVTEVFPGLYSGGISTSSPATNRTSFTAAVSANTGLGTDNSCGGPCWPAFTLPPDANNTTYKAGRNIRYLTEPSVPQTPAWALVNTNQLTVRINFTSANFNNTTARTVGAAFTDPEGRTWLIQNITTDGQVEIGGQNALASGHRVDLNLSKSGKFLVREYFEDPFLGVDLNGNGFFNDPFTVLLADNKSAGTYDTVWVSMTHDFLTGAVNATRYGTPVKFGAGKPIYLIGLQPEFQSVRVKFSSHRSAWDGYWLGTFQSGQNVTVPFRVTSPNGTIPKADVQVTVDRITTWSSAGDTDPALDIPDVANFTDANGIALLSFPTAAIPGGNYLVRYTATAGGAEISPEEKWKLPSFEIRNFIATVDSGVRGSINLSALRPGSNLTELFGETLEARRIMGWRCTPCANGSLGWSGYALDWPINKYFNDTEGPDFGKLFDFNWGTNQFENATPSDNPPFHTVWDNFSATLSMVNNNTLRFNLTRFPRNSPQTDGFLTPLGLNNSPSALYMGSWRMTADNFTAGADGINNSADDNATLHIAYLPWGNVLDAHPSFNHTDINVTSQAGQDFVNFPGPLALRVISVSNQAKAVQFRLSDDRFRATMKAVDNPDYYDGNPANGEVDPRFSRVTTVNASPGVQLYAFNDLKTNRSDSLPGVQPDSTPPKDTLVVENNTSGTPVRTTHRIGEAIPGLQNRYMAHSDRDWGNRILLANHSLTDGLFPLPGWVENSTYYVGRFKESEVGVDINNNFSQDDTFYLLIYDTMWNGVFDPPEGILDDDPDLSRIFNDTGCPQPPPPGASCGLSFDLFGPERGNNSSDFPGGPLRIFDERPNPLFGGFPLNVANRTFGPFNGSLTTLAFQFAFAPGKDLTFLVRASHFNGTPVEGGTVTVSRADLLFGSDNGTQIPPKSLTLAANPVPLAGGEAGVVISASDLSNAVPAYGNAGFNGDFRFIFEVKSGDKAERIERFIHVGPTGQPGGGGGGGASPP
ncbi:MAG: hypothetical protein QXQ87_07650 [Halobacteria archaeon]